MFTKEELEIIKTALAGDIVHQNKILGTIRPEQKEEFQNWLKGTEKVYKKVSKQLFEIKAN